MKKYLAVYKGKHQFGGWENGREYAIWVDGDLESNELYNTISIAFAGNKEFESPIPITVSNKELFNGLFKIIKPLL